MTAPSPAAFVTGPIPLGISLAGYLQATESDRFVEPHPPLPPQLRATPLTVLKPTATPIIVRGVPTLPAYPVIVPVTATAVVGPNHIGAQENTDPVWDPAGGADGNGAWTTPIPASGVGDYRWVVHTLPDPQDYADGYYPLGDRSTSDATAQPLPIEDGATMWAGDPGTPGAPAPSWHSAVPFKPTVVRRESVRDDGTKFTHPRAVSFSSVGNAFMWLDMGKDMPQPFTWVVVALPTSAADQLHYILDAGINPYTVGFPVLTPAQQADAWQVPDNLAYRTTLSIQGPGTVIQNTAVNASGGYGVSFSKKVQFNEVPRMYGMVYNGSNSMLWVRGSDTNQLVRGTVATGAAYKHRYYVLGREYGWISPVSGCEMFVMELRFWHRALTAQDMEDQYAQLSSTYQFEAYTPQRTPS